MIQKIWNWYKARPQASQIFIFFILSGILNGFFLVLVVKYATYMYALKNGFRLPLEGIPYLNELVVIFTATLWVSKFIVLWILHKIISSLIENVSGYAVQINEAKELYKGGKIEVFKTVAQRDGKIQAGIIYLLYRCFPNVSVDVDKTLHSMSYIQIIALSMILMILGVLVGYGVAGNSLILTVTFSVILGYCFFLYVMHQKHEKMRHLIKAIGAAIVILIAPLFIFFGDNFPKILSYLGYGGERLVTLNHVDGNYHNYCLILRTPKSIFVRKISSKNIIEMELSNSITITYLGPRLKCPPVLSKD